MANEKCKYSLEDLIFALERKAANGNIELDPEIYRSTALGLRELGLRRKGVQPAVMESPIAENPYAANRKELLDKLSQGVTTVVFGACSKEHGTELGVSGDIAEVIYLLATMGHEMSRRSRMSLEEFSAGIFLTMNDLARKAAENQKRQEP